MKIPMIIAIIAECFSLQTTFLKVIVNETVYYRKNKAQK
jgi:hypothetical protein